MKKQQPKITVRIINPEAIPQAEKNLARAIAEILKNRELNKELGV